MAAQVLRMFDAHLEAQEDWTTRCVAALSSLLGEIPKESAMFKILDNDRTVPGPSSHYRCPAKEETGYAGNV